MTSANAGLYNLLHALPVHACLYRYVEAGIPGEWHVLYWPPDDDQWQRHNGDTHHDALAALLGPMEADPRDEDAARMLDAMEKGEGLGHMRAGVWRHTFWGWQGWCQREGGSPSGALLATLPEAGNDSAPATDTGA